MTVAVVDIDGHASDASATQAGPFNTEYTTPNLHFGTHKSGVAQQPALRFRGLNIPVGSTINSASIRNESTTITAGTGTFQALIKLLSFDGRWEATSLAAFWASSFSDDDWHVQLLDGAGVLVITGPAASARTGGPNIGGDPGTVVQRIAQGVTITTGGNITTARVSLGGSLVPGTGNIRVEIWSDVAGLPSVPLGASATRPVSDIAPKIAAQVRPVYDFTFTGGDIVAVLATDKVHAVLRCDSIGSGIHQGTARYANPGGDLSPFGTSPDGGYDIQNYFTVDDVWAIPSFGPTVAWTVPIALGFESTPDLAALLQAHIDAPGYVPSDPIGFRYDRVSSTGGIIYAGYPGTTGAVARLTVDFTAPPLPELPDAPGDELRSAAVFPADLIGTRVRQEIRAATSRPVALRGVILRAAELLGASLIPTTLLGGKVVDESLGTGVAPAELQDGKVADELPGTTVAPADAVGTDATDELVGDSRDADLEGT